MSKLLGFFFHEDCSCKQGDIYICGGVYLHWGDLKDCSSESSHYKKEKRTVKENRNISENV